MALYAFDGTWKEEKTGAYEVWFRGVHSDIGGGNKNRGLNDISLKWMMSKAQAAGLPIHDEDILALDPVPTTSLGVPKSCGKPPLATRWISITSLSMTSKIR